MAIGLTIRQGPYVVGDRREVIVDATGDTSYPAGGYAITPANVGLMSRIDSVHGNIARKADGTDAHAVAWDATNNKLQFYAGTGTVQNRFPQNTTADVSGYTARLRFVGV